MRGLWRCLRCALLAAAVALFASAPAFASSGHAYEQVAQLSANTGGMQTPTAAEQQDGTLGTSVAISANGDVLAVGDPAASSVFVFLRPSDEAWKSAHQVIALRGYDLGDSLGTSVAVSSDGKTIVAGAPFENGQNGAVYVWTEPLNGWKHSTGQPTIMLNEALPTGDDYLGASVAINAAGNAIVAGAPGWTGGEGAVYLFVEHTGGWTKGWSGEVPGAGVWLSVGESGGNADYGGNFGQSVAMAADGDTVVVGAPGQNGWEGAIYVLSRYPNGQFAGDREIDDSASGTSDQFFICDPNSGYGIGNPELGTSVSISAGGHTVVAGEPCAGTGGQAVVYTEPSHGWAYANGQITAGLTPLRPAALSIQQDGYAVAISGNGATIIADDPDFQGAGGLVNWSLEPTHGWAHVNPVTPSDFGSIFSPTFFPSGYLDEIIGDPIAVSAGAGSVFVGAVGHGEQGIVDVYNFVSLGATPTSVSCSPSVVPIGKKSSCKVSAKDSAGGSSAPTGTVSLSVNGSSSGHLSSRSCTLKSVSGHPGRSACDFSFTPTSALTYTITAKYGGDLHHHSGSGTTAVTVTRNRGALSFGCTPSSVESGVATDCTATATGVGVTPATIGFQTRFGAFTGEVCTPGSGTISCTVDFTATTPDVYRINASYPGDPATLPAGAQAVITVTAHPTTTTVGECGRISSPASLSCLVTVTDTGSDPTVPTGTVSASASVLSMAPVPAGTCTLAPQTGSSGVATCTIAYATSNDSETTITADYPGDATHASSSGTSNPHPG